MSPIRIMKTYAGILVLWPSALCWNLSKYWMDTDNLKSEGLMCWCGKPFGIQHRVKVPITEPGAKHYLHRKKKKRGGWKERRTPGLQVIEWGPGDDEGVWGFILSHFILHSVHFLKSGKVLIIDTCLQEAVKWLIFSFNFELLWVLSFNSVLTPQQQWTYLF